MNGDDTRVRASWGGASGLDYREGGARVLGARRVSQEALAPVPYSRVTFGEGYWGFRQEANRQKSLWDCYGRLESEGHLDNFREAVAGSRSTPRRGLPVFDSDVYKWLEAVGWELGRSGTNSDLQKLRSVCDEVISLVVAAQREDGYVSSWFRTREARFSDLVLGLELYCAGHLFQAAVAWQQGAGDDRLLGVATRFADYIGSVFGPEGLQRRAEHPGIEMALVELYRATGVERYLSLASFFLEARGHELLAARLFWPSLSSGRRALPPGTRGSGPCGYVRLPGLWGA